ncbi:MAG: glycosyltransferase [Candidatus Asgardarchaeia archaeon]
MEPLLYWVHNLRKVKVTENKTLLETTKYKTMSFWWVLYVRLYYDILKLLKDKKTRKQFSIGILISARIKSILYLLLYLPMIALFSKVLFNNRDADTKAVKILSTSQFTGWRKSYDIFLRRRVSGHYVLSPVLRKLKLVNPSITLASTIPFGLSFFSRLKTALDMGHCKYCHFKPLEYYFSWSILLTVLKARRNFIRTWNNIKAYLSKESTIQYNGVNVFNMIKDYFEYYFKMYLPMMSLYYELTLRALKIEKPHLVLMVNEYGGFERILVSLAEHLGIPVLALQHGLISQYHPGYMYLREEVGANKKDFISYVPLPEKTAVYGPYYKHLLTKVSSYPEPAVTITGAPHYDLLVYADKIYDKVTFCKKFGLNPNKKIVLIGTQPFPVESIRMKFFDSVISSLSDISEVQVVVKPHPGEDSSWHVRRLQMLGIKNVAVLPPKSDVYEAIFSCDVYISVSSTTILEAMILKKPVLVVNLFGLPEVLPWTKEGAVLAVYNPDELNEGIHKLLFNESFKMELAKRRDAFLYKYIYKLDGKATDRIIDVVNGLLSQFREK